MMGHQVHFFLTVLRNFHHDQLHRRWALLYWRKFQNCLCVFCGVMQIFFGNISIFPPDVSRLLITARKQLKCISLC